MRTNFPDIGAMYTGQKIPGFDRPLSYLWAHGRPFVASQTEPTGLWVERYQKPEVQRAFVKLISQVAVVYGAGRGQVAAASEEQVRKTATGLAGMALAGETFDHPLHREAEMYLIMNEAVRTADAIFSYAGDRTKSNFLVEEARGVPADDEFLDELLADAHWDGKNLSAEHMRAAGSYVTSEGLKARDLSYPPTELSGLVHEASERYRAIAEDTKAAAPAIEVAMTQSKTETFG